MSKRSVMPSTASAEMPWVGGGKLATWPSAYAMRSGSIQSERCSARSSSASGLPAAAAAVTRRRATSPW